MPHAIKLKSGKLITPFSIEQVLEEVDTHMGPDARHYIEDWKRSVDGDIEYAEYEKAEAQKELERFQDHNHAMIVELKGEAEAIEEMLDAPRLNRSKLQDAVRNIINMLWSEM